VGEVLRRQAEAASTAMDRLHLLRIADEFDRLADSME
jgi:purine nucleoside permease